MLIRLDEILQDAEKKGYAVPAFNTYNMESVMGVINAANRLKSPVILQVYSRLFGSDNGEYLAEIIKKAALKANVPVCFHLDHGASMKEVIRAIRYGATGVMLDVSTLPFEENVMQTKTVVDYCTYAGIGVEGEIGHIGSVNDAEFSEFTTADDARLFAEQTGVSALAVMVGTAHGRYKQAPKLGIERIAEIKDAAKVPLVLHGGSGIPDDQIIASIKAGIRKINFGTDLCFAFIEGVKESDESKYALDMFMKKAIDKVDEFATSKIKLLGAEGRA